MKPSYETNSLSVQISNLKTSLAFWDDLISKSSKLTASMNVTTQCMSGFIEAFQKIADIAETNDAGLRPFGIALRRYCLRQRCIESRLRNFNSQITDCLVTPLSDRLEEWRRTSNQMDRDSVKELRKAKSELQRAMLEAEKCKKRVKRKDRGGVTAAFEKDDYDASNVQINFVQHDLACKQRALEHLEQRCQESVALEERRRFAELATCLNPLVDTHLNVLTELVSLEEVLKEIQAAHSAVIASVTDSSSALISTDTNSDGTFSLRSTPLVKSNEIASGNGTTATTSANNHQSIPLDPTIATGSAALSYAVAPAPSTLSITSTSTNGGGSVPFGHAESISTLHSPDAEGVSRIIHTSILPQPTFAGLGRAGSPETVTESLNGGGSVIGGGDSLSLFDHNQSTSGAPTVRSASSSSSLGHLPINCDVASGLGSLGDSASSNGMGDVNALNEDHRAGANDSDDGSDEDGGTTEGCLTEEDDNDETLEQTNHTNSASPANVAPSIAMEKSVLYPNQALPPPVYTNIGKLQAAAQRGVSGSKKDVSSSSTTFGSSAATASANGFARSHRAESPPISDTHPSDGRKYSQPTATISKGGMATLLRSLSISGRPPSLVPPNPSSSFTPQQAPCEGSGEGLGLSPPRTSSLTPIIADQATTSPPPHVSNSNSLSSSYVEARSRIDAIFSGHRMDSPQPPLNISPIDPLGVEGLDLGGVGNTSTFRRKRLPHFQQQSQTLTRTAGINLMRGSMFQLNTVSTSAGVSNAMELDGRCEYGYGARQTPMTPGPSRRAPMSSQLSNATDSSGQVIRPPRRSSSVCRELPSLSQQQPPAQFHQLQQPASQQLPQHLFPPSTYFQHHQQQINSREQLQLQQSKVTQSLQQQPLPASGHFTAPRGVQQNPQRVYADPRSFQQQCTGQNGIANSPSAGTAAQLAVEAAARRNQQYAAASVGLRNPSTLSQRTMSPNQNGTTTPSRLPQRQTMVSANSISNSTSSVRAVKNQRGYYGQQQAQHQHTHKPQSNIPSSGYGYGYSSTQQHQQCSQQSHLLSQQNLNYLHQQNTQEFPPPPAAFDDVECTNCSEGNQKAWALSTFWFY